MIGGVFVSWNLVEGSGSLFRPWTFAKLLFQVKFVERIGVAQLMLCTTWAWLMGTVGIAKTCQSRRHKNCGLTPQKLANLNETMQCSLPNHLICRVGEDLINWTLVVRIFWIEHDRWRMPCYLSKLDPVTPWQRRTEQLNGWLKVCASEEKPCRRTWLMKTHCCHLNIRKNMWWFFHKLMDGSGFRRVTFSVDTFLLFYSLYGVLKLW